MLLKPTALGFSMGILVAVCLVIMSLVNSQTGVWSEVIRMTGDAYIGYNATIKGTLIGMVYGFLDGFVGGYLLAWMYNKFAK